MSHFFSMNAAPSPTPHLQDSDPHPLQLIKAIRSRAGDGGDWQALVVVVGHHAVADHPQGKNEVAGVGQRHFQVEGAMDDLFQQDFRSRFGARALARRTLDARHGIALLMTLDTLSISRGEISCQD